MSEQERGFARFYWPLIALAALLLAGFFVIEFAAPARALPSYARQTGQPCGTCHTDFAGLTPYGRRFKINGYTNGGGQYRTTLFPFDDSTTDYQRPWVPPISMMATPGFTNLSIPQPADPNAHNNNITIAPLSFFWGGAITDHIGAFAQVTYDGEPAASGIGVNPFVHAWHWDNVDVRFADSTTLGKMNITYGITANNSPTVQDPWNTTPAWAFPYASSPFWPGMASGPAPIIDGGFAQSVGSVGGYVYINDLIYLETSVYRTLSPGTQNALGVDPTGLPGLFNAAPYWRAAFEPHWGPHWLEVGTFGMIANVHPFVGFFNATSSVSPFDTSTFPQTDKYTDIGFDTQYQYQGSNFWFTLRGTYIHEQQKLDATFNLFPGPGVNLTNELNEARAYASLAYGNNNRVVLTGQYFDTWGSQNLMADTKGWIAEIAYIPFISSFSPGWPWFNARIGLQYTWYEQFNGTSVGASENNTLFAYIWLAM